MTLVTGRWNAANGETSIIRYTGLLTTDATMPPIFPNTWITPNYVFDFQVPRVVYVPVAVPTMPQQPAVQPVQVAAVTLHRGAAPADVQVTPGSVVTWSNGDNADCNLVLAQSPSSGAGASSSFTACRATPPWRRCGPTRW